MNKSTNKYRHKWIEPFDAPFTYICSKCGKHKIKETMYTARDGTPNQFFSCDAGPLSE